MNRCSATPLSRSAIHRCLVRLGVARLPPASPDAPGWGDSRPPPAATYLDLVLSQLQKQPSYVFVAIDRATRYVWVKVLANGDAGRREFLAMHTILIMMARLPIYRKKPAGRPKHITCAGRMGSTIDPALSSVMVERFNRRLSEQSQPPLRPHSNPESRRAERLLPIGGASTIRPPCTCYRISRDTTLCKEG